MKAPKKLHKIFSYQNKEHSNAVKNVVVVTHFLV